MHADVDLALAAGLMEGEGSVRLNRPTGRNQGCLLVSMVNTDRQLVEFMQDRWPGSYRPASGLRPDQRDAWRWTIAARKAMGFLDEIEPFVISDRMKRRIAAARHWQELKAKHWRYRTDDDREDAFNCWHWMAELNRRGVA